MRQNNFINYQGKHLFFRFGRIKYDLIGRNYNDGAIDCRFSVISPGTERWQKKHFKQKDYIPTGYINIGKKKNNAIVSPAPHGAQFFVNENCLKVPLDTQIEMIALARFSLILASIFDKLPKIKKTDRIIILGGGPVAIGAYLEISRRGFTDVVLVSSSLGRVHHDSFFRIKSTLAKEEQAAVVIECTGRAGRIKFALAHVKKTGLIGLLGAPHEQMSLPTPLIFKQNISLIGLRENFDNPKMRQKQLRAIIKWLQSKKVPVAEFCQIISSSKAVVRYSELLKHRFIRPIVIIKW